MYDIIFECEHKGVDGLILLVDFEKAFDSLLWRFIHQSLLKFNFGENFIKWISLFQHGSNSKIILNGHLSDSFTLHRGCRQGDPISPYLFILCSEFLTLAIKNNDNIEGIKVLNKTHKSSQYADDTSVYLKATERNLRNCLITLEWFYYVSGLKININKTKVIRIGPIRETDRRFCRENNLEWVSKYTALGIGYDLNDFQNITTKNIGNKIESMKKILHLWYYRNITPIGRVCIAKSLVLSKIIHVLQSLPSPEAEYMKTIEKLCIDFIWRNKRHEVNKNTLCLPTDQGGMNMVNLPNFDKSLKITWLRKLLNDTPDWIEFANHYKINRLTTTDINYHKIILRHIDNPFWKSVAKAYSEWFSHCKAQHDTPIGKECLWGNPRVNIPFCYQLYKNGIIYLEDIFDHEGRQLSKQQLDRHCNINLMFTTYFSICKALPREWKYTMGNAERDYNITLPTNIAILLKDKRGTTSIRKIWTQASAFNPPTSQQKWNIEYGNNEWKYLYQLSHQCKFNARIIYFQYQILHRSLVTNKKLEQFGIRDNNLCDDCGTIETIPHLLYNCPERQLLWQEVIDWLTITMNRNITADEQSVILGNKNNDLICNYVMIVTKHEIYKAKWNKTKVTLAKVKRVLKYLMETDIYISNVNHTLPKTLGKWSSLYNVLRNLR